MCKQQSSALQTLQTLKSFLSAGEGVLHDSNSLSLLTDMSGVEAPVPRGPVPELQSLFSSGLPGRCGEEPWRCALCSEEHSGELPEGWRDGSCCSLGKITRGRRIFTLNMRFRSTKAPTLLNIKVPKGGFSRKHFWFPEEPLNGQF